MQVPRAPGAVDGNTKCRTVQAIVLLGLLMTLAVNSLAQDGSTSAVWGTVFDPTGARVSAAQVKAVNSRTGVERSTQTDAQGMYSFQFLPAGEYSLEVSAAGLTTQRHTGLKLDVGGLAQLDFRLTLAGPEQVVTVEAQVPEVEPAASQVSSVIDQKAIEDLPLNGRRFSELALLTPGVTQDPRSLTSTATGDLAFGGVRGFQSSFLVDGADNNNAFFAQARGRYRAPYQFSNEVVQEFRVSSNTYGAELGRAGGAVVNVVTKSGANQTHGSLFYYWRDSSLAAQHPFLKFKPRDHQHQFGFTLGGRLARNRIFYFGGFDQHIFRVPTVVRFLPFGALVVTPTPADFEFNDQALVFEAASQLSLLGGEFRSAQTGNAGFFKLDVALSPRHYLTGRISTSRYSGDNNVFLDPTSPVTNSAVTSNGEESVHTESVVASLTSALTFRSTSHLRVQFSRDRQESTANSSEVRTRVSDILDSFGRSSILPRETREQRVHIAETLSFDGRRHSFKFGGDVSLVSISNFFPLLFGGQYIFDDIRVNPFTFVPQTFGLSITPLRAYAHTVPRFYSQNFGLAESHPDTREYALFAQDSIRVTERFALTLGVRWDLQTFRSDRLVSNPLWPDSGRVPKDTNNFAPRLGFAWSIGEKQPLVIRGGTGIFYTRIPQIYNSAIEAQNGLARTHLFLDNSEPADQAFFPAYPDALAVCGPQATACEAPPSVTSRLTSEISAFASNFQTPFVHQASLTVEREVAKRFAIAGSYLYVHGQHLIRARDMNLPEPITLTYPVFDEDDVFLNEFLDVQSFGTWQSAPTVECPFPRCINDVVRPLPQVGPINVFESAASSVYHGFTFSARRRMTNGLYFRLAYTFARAIDDTQDALVAGRPALVENSFATQAERGSSVTDQRHRFVASWIYETRWFHRDRPGLSKLFNDWKLAGVVTAGSGRPVNARTFGDANRDNNTDNDRLPGVARNSFVGPDYATVDLRLSRRLVLRKKLKLDLMVEAFNTFNRANKRVAISDDGFVNTAAQFVQIDKTVNGFRYPAHYQQKAAFLQPTDAYAPRQVQFAVKLTF